MGKMLIFGVKKTQLLHDTQLDYIRYTNVVRLPSTGF